MTYRNHYPGAWAPDNRESPSQEFDDEQFDYSQDDLEGMYQDAFEGDSSAMWNID